MLCSLAVPVDSPSMAILLNFFGTSLSDSTGESLIPMDSNLQKSSTVEFVGSDLSRQVRKVVSLSIPLPCVNMSILDSVGFSTILEALPDSIQPSLEPSM